MFKSIRSKVLLGVMLSMFVCVIAKASGVTLQTWNTLHDNLVDFFTPANPGSITNNPTAATTNVTWNGTYTLASTTTGVSYSDSWSFDPKLIAQRAVMKISAVTSGSTLVKEVCEDTFTEGAADADCHDNQNTDGYEIFSNVTTAGYYNKADAPIIAGSGKKMRYRYQQFNTAVAHNVTVQRDTLTQN